MARSYQIHTKKASLVLAVTVVSYSTIATFLYMNYHINLMDYSTPIILGTIGTILTFGILRCCFDKVLATGNLEFSFGKQITPRTTMQEQAINNPTYEEPTPGKGIIGHNFVDNYEERLAEVEREKAERQKNIMLAIHEYTTFIATEFLSKEDLATLHENIEYLAHGQYDLYKPIKSIDLRHFAWNIGERLNLPLIDRAEFIHSIFPHELKNATIEYLAQNLRAQDVCKRPLDIPKNGDFHFNYMKKVVA